MTEFRRTGAGALLLAFTLLACAGAEKPPATGAAFRTITEARRAQPRYAGDPQAVRSMNPMFDTFPDSSLVDFSFLLDPPAGKHGFVERDPAGHFRIAETGKRVRFWGVTVAANHVDIPKDRIEVVVDVLARAGCNLLRLHELDNRGAEKYNLVRRNIIDEAYPNHDKSTEFDLEYRDRVDYWIARAQEKGMYVYLVVRGYRTFRAGDGVPNADLMDRAAKPYAFFDPRLIELQKQYAEDWLIRHVNPYTGIPNGLNPAVALIELENEDSLFFGHVAWRDFVEPYRANFQAMWNEWLRARYTTTEALRAAWTNNRGECPLQPGEAIETGGVELPAMNLKPLEQYEAIPWTDPINSPARTRDAVRFAVKLQRDYFATLRDFLRARGCRAPFTAVVHAHVAPDTWSVARELEFVGENAYLDHPSFSPGSAWVGRAFYSNKNYIRETNIWSLGPHLARYRWSRSPLVCREWATCWPNEYRASAALDIASFSRLQDYDGLIHFAYYTWGNPDMIQAFGPQADPSRWGLFGYSALLFLDEELPADSRPVVMAYTEEDFATWASYMSPFHRLSYGHRMVNRLVDDAEARGGFAPDNPLVTITSGRSGRGVFTGNNLVLYDARYAAWREKPAAEQKEGLLRASGYDHSWIYAAETFPADQVRQAGFEPILPDGPACRGFYDAKRNSIVLAQMSEQDAADAARHFAARLRDGKPGFGSALDPEPEQWTTLDGALVRDTKEGVLRIAGKRLCAIGGEFAPDKEYTAGVLRVKSASPIATVAAVSLDGRPLEQARRLAIKMVTVAQNRGQRLEKVEESGAPSPYVLASVGDPPVQTLGKPAETPTRIAIGDRNYVEAYLVNGTWEIVVDLDRRECLVHCDTPNIRFVLDRGVFGVDEPERVRITKYFSEHPPTDAGQSGWDFVYPGFAKYARLESR